MADVTLSTSGDGGILKRKWFPDAAAVPETLVSTCL
jgi:hypothetical protein